MEPREHYPRRAFVFVSTGAAPACRNGLVGPVPPGSKNRASAHQGSPGTWDALRSPRRTSGGGPDHQLQAYRLRVLDR
jgi:hypothetical protein